MKKEMFKHILNSSLFFTFTLFCTIRVKDPAEVMHSQSTRWATTFSFLPFESCSFLTSWWPSKFTALDLSFLFLFSTFSSLNKSREAFNCTYVLQGVGCLWYHNLLLPICFQALALLLCHASKLLRLWCPHMDFGGSITEFISVQCSQNTQFCFRLMKPTEMEHPIYFRLFALLTFTSLA